MIARHCGKRVVTVSDNIMFFRVRCKVCHKVFRQNKRQSHGLLAAAIRIVSLYRAKRAARG